MGVYPGPIGKACPRVGGVEENIEAQPEEPPIDNGGNVVEVTGSREDATTGEPRVLYVEIKDGTASVPDCVEDWLWMVAGTVDGDDIVADDVADPEDIDVLSPTCSRSDDSRAGSESARALEIA